jgi:CheY-like chemotaxis protein
MKPVNILLAEDDQLDVIDIKRSLSKMNILFNLITAKNGEEAVALLSNADAATQLPDIALIDINMPKMNGLELLQIIRSTDEWKHLKCFMVTTSDERIDRATAEKLGVSGYIIKPLKLSSPSSMDSFNLAIDLVNLKRAE